MSISQINKPIQVGAVFGSGIIHPKWFKFDRRRYDIKKVNYAWQSPEGETLIYHFSVDDGANSYEIAFNSKAMTWRLNKAEGE